MYELTSTAIFLALNIAVCKNDFRTKLSIFGVFISVICLSFVCLLGIPRYHENYILVTLLLCGREFLVYNDEYIHVFIGLLFCIVLLLIALAIAVWWYHMVLRISL